MGDEEKTRVAGPDNPKDIQEEMERFFEHLGRWKRPVFFFEKAWKPRCDVSETGDEVIIVADIANVTPENVDIAVGGNRLVIRGVRREAESTPRRHYHLMEISYGLFERALEIPARVDPERATANYDDGFLEIRLPKIARKSPGEVEVNVSAE